MATDYPDDADGDALRRVAADGADMSKPMDIDFFIAASDEATAKVVADKAAELGYRTEICFEDDVGSVDPWTCGCTKAMVPTYQAVIAAQAELDAIARPLGTYTDGWGTLADGEQYAMTEAEPAAAMGGDFKRIASYTNVWEAELSRCRLADKQIPAFLGNVVLVSWFWHFSNAVGGVTVHVARRDAKVASRIVTLIRTGTTKSQPSWTCPSCNATVSGSWLVCWQCGASADGNQALRCAEDEAVTEPVVESIQVNTAQYVALCVVVVLMAVVVCGGLLLTLATVPFVALFIVFDACDWWRIHGTAVTERFRQSKGQCPKLKQRPVPNALVVRAWRAAVFGFFVFPPLGLYSLWLLHRVAAYRIPLSRTDRLRYRVAIILDLCAILIGVLLLALPLLMLCSASSRSCHNFLVPSAASAKQQDEEIVMPAHFPLITRTGLA